MNITQLKASLQLAEMRLKSAPSEANEALYKQAKDVYDKAKSELSQKTESPKNEALSVESLNQAQKEYLASLATVQKVVEDKAPIKPAVKKAPAVAPIPAPVVEPVAVVQPVVTPQGSDGQTGSDSENDEKKTEAQS